MLVALRERKSQIQRKGSIFIYLITKDEAMEIRSRYPSVPITIVNKFKKAKRRRYFVEESNSIRRYLEEKRGVRFE